jgi:hypothetical protein
MRHFFIRALLVVSCAAGCGAEPDEITLRQSPVIFQEPGGNWNGVCQFGNTQCTVWTQDGTQSLSMHCCPTRTAMQGAYMVNNEFLCRKIIPDTQHEDCFLDTSTVRNGMKACPLGSYMKGYHQVQNKTACCWYDGANKSTNFVVDTGTQSSRNYIGRGCVLTTGHVCESDRAMEGIQASSNWFLCGK